MKQRLGVAAALLKDPDLVVLDEPTNGLDPAGMRDMRRWSAGWARGAHGHPVQPHAGEVQQVCDRVGVIDRGRMIAESTVEELRGEGELVVAPRRPTWPARPSRPGDVRACAPTGSCGSRSTSAIPAT